MRPVHQLNCVLLALFAVIALLAGCTDKQSSEETEPTPAPTNEAVVAKLGQADALDGTVDKIVTKCAACALRMDGDQENKLEVHGYAMHFCSDGCKGKYAAEPDKAIMALKIPE